MFGDSSELASVMEFGFKRRQKHAQLTRTGSSCSRLCVLYKRDRKHFSKTDPCLPRKRKVLRPQFFTDFDQTLHAAQKCGRIDALLVRQIGNSLPILEV